jgi:hypothetical protein
MTEQTAEQVRESGYRLSLGVAADLGHVIRLLGDFDLAKDALHDVFCAALERPVSECWGLLNGEHQFKSECQGL